jgi:hypothetical protein
MEYKSYKSMMDYVHGGYVHFSNDDGNDDEETNVDTDVPSVIDMHIIEGGEEKTMDNISAFLKQFSQHKKRGGESDGKSDGESGGESDGESDGDDAGPLIINDSSDSDDSGDFIAVIDSSVESVEPGEPVESVEPDDNVGVSIIIDDSGDSGEPSELGEPDEHVGSSESFENTDRILKKYEKYLE